MEVGAFCSSAIACDRYGHVWFLSSKTWASSGPKPPIWRLLWRKIKREKRKFKIFDISTTSVHSTYYDPFTYSLNFDQGSAWDDADDLSRSFSARFAVPSRIFEKNNNGVLVV